ncbi:hypothetical protein [Microbacterium sp. PM5]|uniref:hypothetical protein n=1 Tax=Microbacterium sp. PM5 TaxID=2014534 RepID=UPI000DD15184|nr:hypothetical protein [Microbacterium sp. PM5]AXA96641.1 hypothetical protein CEP17_09605 [Microbacterium sp. PM5]
MTALTTTRRAGRLARRAGRVRRRAAILALGFGTALVFAAAVPLPAAAQSTQSIAVRAPAPGHTVDARYCAPSPGFARTATLTVPSTAGPAVTAEHGLRVTLRSDRGVVLADGLGADELRRIRIDLGRLASDESACVVLTARMPTTADDSFRTAAGEVTLRVDSEGMLPGGVLAATGMNGDHLTVAAAAGAALILVAGLLLIGGTRRRARRLACVAVCTCGVLVVGALAVGSWAAFTDKAAVAVAASGQFGIAVRDSAGIARLPRDGRVTVSYVDTGDLVPGNTAVLTLAVFNNSLAADGRMALRLTAAGTLAPFVRYSVSMDADGSSSVLAGTPDTPATGVAMSGDGLRADLGLVAAAGIRLADGDTVPSSAARAVRTLTVKLHLLDDPRLHDLTGGDLALHLEVVGRSA